MQNLTHKRYRSLYFLWIALVIAAGLASRSAWLGLPWFWAKYSGDALWTLMVFFAFAWLWPAVSTAAIAMLALVFSCAVEFSQLYHAPWLDAIRQTWLGRLALGDTFSWADMLAYLVGAVFGAGLEQLARGFAGTRSEQSAGEKP